MRVRLLGALIGALVFAGAALTPPMAAASPGAGPAAVTNVFAGRAMWIWELSDSNGLGSLVATARAYGVRTLIIKSSDGSGMWEQFTPALVRALHGYGLRVCAWQYVYGTHPIYEAQAGATAVRDGADCLMIDAEGEYDGRYEQAQSYMRELRHLIGYRYPLALAGLPYVDYHPAFPYSVFLGLGGAQDDAPQMYWTDIGSPVDQVYSHTYLFNRPYNRPILPLGEVYADPPSSQVRRFRQLSVSYGAGGVSWWDWEPSLGTWHALAQPLGALAGFRPTSGMASLGDGAEGDLVVWAQEHLVSAGEGIGVDGAFGPETLAAVRGFQRAHHLPVTGVIDTDTWAALLRYRPARIVWSSGAVIARGERGLTPPPESAALPDKRDEIAGAGGAGYPARR